VINHTRHGGPKSTKKLRDELRRKREVIVWKTVVGEAGLKKSFWPKP
jgi:hypothetical protein